MFSKQKDGKSRNRDRPRGEKSKPSLSQLGLLEIPTASDLAHGGMMDDDDDDSDLEAELLALTGAGKTDIPISKLSKPKKAKQADAENLDAMVAECMNDVEEDEDINEDDADLLAELSFLVPQETDEPSQASPSKSTPSTKNAEASIPSRPAPAIVRPSPFLAGQSVITLLNERIQMYKEAEANAIAANETARVKRFSRGLKTLNQMLKTASSGKAINEEDIPPAVLVSSSRSNSSVDLRKEAELPQTISPSSTMASTIPQNVAFHPQPTSPKYISVEKMNEPPSSSLTFIQTRLHEYKMAAVAAKRTGDRESALQLLRISKQIEPLLQAAKEGRPVDLDSLPPPPPPPPSPQATSLQGAALETTRSNVPDPLAEEAAGDPSDKPQEAAQSVPDSPAAITEALEQRLAKYCELRDKAKAEGNARKERMNQRIMKQYQEALKVHKVGRYVDFSELPTPLGFSPLPSAASSQPPAAPVAAAPLQPDATPKSSQRESIAEDRTQALSGEARPQPPPRQAPSKPAVKQDVRKAPQSMVERQVSVLRKRQQNFRAAALEAKRKGEIEQAKEYLRNCKGIDQLLLATSSGLPIDMNTVPIPPQEAALVPGGGGVGGLDFEVVEKEDCIAAPPSTPSDVALAFTKLEEDLVEQIKMCARTREHFKAVGDVASSNRFEKLILDSKKDLDAVRVAFKRGDKPPRFHYETRTFTIIQCNTDLSDSDCEVSIVRGVNLNTGSSGGAVDVYVRVEFPFPSDAPPQEKTPVVRQTKDPNFNHKVVFSIDRKARALARVFKRHGIKCQVVVKGGWFHRDSVLGTVKVPLVALETKCVLHESFDLVDERKKMVGGKLEVKVRLRNPIVTKDLQKVTEKWVVIDGF